ncbi:hypothetical protein [Halorubrum aethiopicum]|uniref:hypothetical protein n=1 Tax=Halorubrum aethiopicum TaxID=1758255 RepID=UPI0008305B9C|nr:hypothetical protein [Halorubrum aethiopicum]
MVHDPLSPSEALRTRVGATLAALGLLVLVYGVLIVAELLLAVLVAGSLTAGAYLSYRTFAVLDAVADAAQRVADAKERESDRSADRDASSGTEPNRLTERER